MTPALSRCLVSAAAVVVLTSVVIGGVLEEWHVLAVGVGCGFGVGVGWLIAHRDATSPVAPALAWATAGPALVAAHAGPLAKLPWGTGIWPVNLVGVFALLLVFPGGRLTGWLWRAVPGLFGAATLGMIVSQWDAELVDGQVVGGPEAPWLECLAIVSLLSIGVCMIAGIVSLFLHYRRGDARVRRQIRLVLLAGIVVVLLLIMGWILEALGSPVEAAYTPFIVAIITALPGAVGIAIVRHDLFDIDRILSETTAWLFSALVSVGVFGVVVFAFAQVASHYADVAAAVAVFVATLPLLPVHRALSSAVGRLVDPDRHVALHRVERFGSDVRTGRRAPEEIETVLREAQGDDALQLLLAAPGLGWVDMACRPVEVQRRGRRRRDRPHRAGWDSARARRRIADLTKVAWVPIEVSRLRLVLRTAVAEVEASRLRLMAAAAGERRRLERELHDGAQQRIVATGMRLRTLQRRLTGGSQTAYATEIDAAVTELEETVAELRRLAHGVRPDRLSDGLGPALAPISDTSPVPLTIRVEEPADLDETRRLTAYLVVSEAITNALKHAAAHEIVVTIAPREERVAIEVTDDGVGGVDEIGLVSLRDRVQSVGGVLRVDSPVGSGTRIEALI